MCIELLIHLASFSSVSDALSDTIISCFPFTQDWHHQEFFPLSNIMIVKLEKKPAVRAFLFKNRLDPLIFWDKAMVQCVSYVCSTVSHVVVSYLRYLSAQFAIYKPNVTKCDLVNCFANLLVMNGTTVNST